MTSVLKNLYSDELDNIVYKYSSTYHIIEMETVDVMSRTCIDFGKENNEKDLKCKVGDYVIPNFPEYVFVIKRVKNTVSWNMS